MTARPMREARIDLAAITHNVERLRSLVGAPNTMAVVKADGYGHGAVQAAGAALAGGADWLGVVDIVEALELRASGVTAPVLTWLLGPDDSFDEAIAMGVDLGIGSPRLLDRAAAASGTASVHIKVDTGLGRGGVPLDECAALFAAAAAHQRAGRLVVRGLFSHLANAGPEEDRTQVDAFELARGEASAAGLDIELAHLAATAGALRVPDARFDLVRLGIGVYGLSPFDDSSSADLGLRPALELSAAIVSVKRASAGSGVSYGYTYRTTEDTRLALVPIGYADGLPRQASSRARVSINGVPYPIAGRVAMDQFVVDVGSAADVAPGDRAVIFGDPATGVPSADDLARDADTINYEIVTRLGRRIERTYVA